MMNLEFWTEFQFVQLLGYDQMPAEMTCPVIHFCLLQISMLACQHCKLGEQSKH